MTTRDAPCLKCKNRSYGCHSGCTLYAEYRAVHTAAGRKREQDRMALDTLVTVKRHHVRCVTKKPICTKNLL